MSEDLERRLSALTPRGAPAELRHRILGAVDAELARESPRRFPLGLATAAALLLSVWLDQLAIRNSESLVDRAFGPAPASPRAVAIARDVAEVAGPEAGRWALDRLSVRSDVAPDPVRRAAELRRLVRELTLEIQEVDDETTHPQIPQVGRDRVRPLPGRILLVERLVYGSHRPTA